MSAIGQVERMTQQRVVKLFRDALGYDYLGDWTDRIGNRNIEEDLLRTFLREHQGYDEALITRALHLLERAAGDTSRTLYDRNREVYDMLRYAVKVKPGAGENTVDVWLIDWEHPEKNHFAIAEEVTVAAADDKAHEKRPDVVLFVNGIALGVLELKRSTISIAEGIRQNLDNQKKEFIQPFFSTMQWVMAGNDTEGLRYGTIQTPEKYYLTWKEDGAVDSVLDRALSQMCCKARFLELIHDFIVFDAGVKKLCRHHQYFGVRAAQGHVRRREGGIIWHTQGSGKSLVMVWLTKWIREHVKDARVLLITDRTELEEQIERVFYGVNEDIYRTQTGADLIARLNATTPWLMCSLVHKFGGREDGEEVGDIAGYIEEVKKALPAGFSAKGNLFVFVDECHRTQSGELHKAMKVILPSAVFIGFTGTPLLRADKKRSIEVFGGYIHTYKFHEAVKDRVVLDLRYEARDIDQRITSQAKIDQWFEAKTRGLTDLAKAQLKQRWGTMQKVLSSQSRLEQIVADILMDMATRDRLSSGHGNALLVAGSIYEACKFYDLFDKTDLKGRCAIVTSYAPSAAKIKGEESGEGDTDNIEKYNTYRQMLADWFSEAPEKAVNRVEEFEAAAKKRFINEPGQLKLLIVVDKLLTGFDAPPATCLYIDKQMRDHGLFQAICRVNRLDGDDKEYGYIIDYKDLFKSLEGAVHDYTSGALDGYDKEDVAGLLDDRLGKARGRLEEALEAVRAICELVEPPRDQQAYFRYFSSKDSGNAEQLKDNEPQRLSLYKLTAALVRAYADIANEMAEAGYRPAETEAIKKDVAFYENLRNEVKLHSGDAIDLKRYEPAMRHLIDTYIQAEVSEKVSAFDDLSLVQLIVERGAGAVNALPDGIRKNEEAVAETIENNVRKLIIDESPINPKYYEKMSQLLDALIEQRRQAALDYAAYLSRIVDLTKQAKSGPAAAAYPSALATPAMRALYDNLERNEILALAVDAAVRANRQDDWRNNPFKVKRVRNAIMEVLFSHPARPSKATPNAAANLGGEGPAVYITEPEAMRLEELLDKILSLVKNQNEY
jgi:type I restriction enzyme R subunit